MSNILKEKIIIPAWLIIKNDYKIKKFYLFPGLLSIIFLTILLVYQSIYTYVELFWKKEEALIVILNFFHSDYFTEILVWSLIFIIIYFISIPIFEGWLIKYLDKKNEWIELSISDIIWQGLFKFWSIFEFNNIFSEFKIISILNGYLFTIRFLWINYISKINIIFVAILIFGIILNIFISYSKYIIVLENKSIFKSIWISSKITILNLKNTIKLYFLLMVLNLRVIFNFLIFLIFPIIIVLVIWYITTKIFLIFTLSILSIIFLLFIIALWYLSSVLEVFKTAIWYNAYKVWKKQIEEDQ